MPLWLALLGAYLIGSLDFAVVVARARGVDIRKEGSGNPGTSNVMRTLGKGPAALVFLGDSLKGVIAAAFGFLASGGEPTNPVVFTAGLIAVIGHCFPLYHRFKGGKGVATAAGVLLFAVPPVVLVLTVVWLAVAKLSKVASIASLVTIAMTIPLSLWRGVNGLSLVALSLMLVLILWKHTPNIRRMLAGNEQKVTR